jgi:hypothetical protein
MLLLFDRCSSLSRYKDLSASLTEFDKRTVELLLSRLIRDPPPSHLADLRITEVMEQHGRERRHRYFTFAAYRKAFPQDPHYSNIDISQSGGFQPVDPSNFYKDQASLDAYVDHMRAATATVSASAAKKRVNPIMPDGTVKKGRPRKYPIGTSRAQQKRKRAVQEAEEPVADAPPVKKKKGRPRAKEEPAVITSPTNDGGDGIAPKESISVVEPIPKRRGRTRKKALVSGGSASTSNIQHPQSLPEHNLHVTPASRRRRRPQKTPLHAQGLMEPEPVHPTAFRASSAPSSNYHMADDVNHSNLSITLDDTAQRIEHRISDTSPSTMRTVVCNVSASLPGIRTVDDGTSTPAAVVNIEGASMTATVTSINGLTPVASAPTNVTQGGNASPTRDSTSVILVPTTGSFSQRTGEIPIGAVLLMDGENAGRATNEDDRVRRSFFFFTGSQC